MTSEENTVKRSKIFYTTLIVVVVIIIALVLYLLLKKSDSSSGHLSQMQKMVNKINNLESEVQEKQNEIFELITDYKEKTGEQILPANLMNLSEEEKRILEKKINEEKDVSMKSLLSEVLDKNKEIAELKDNIKRIEALLPKPHIVLKGQNHYQIAMDFLLNEKGVAKKKAMKLVERTLLFDSLVPGFKVWNFYSGDEYGTFITQGSAPISPNEISRRNKKILVDAKDKAISERDVLSKEVTSLETRKEELISHLDLLNTEKESLLTQMTDLNKNNVELQRTVNSVYYVLDLKRNLKKKGILKGGFLKSTKLNDVSPEYFNRSMDLRAEASLYISASAFKRRRIRKISIYPRFFQKGKDYQIEIEKDKKNASLTFKNILKFKNEKIVIAVK